MRIRHTLATFKGRLACSDRLGFSHGIRIIRRDFHCATPVTLISPNIAKGEPHKPVLCQQVVQGFCENLSSGLPDLTIVDCTVGAGGHSTEIIKAFGTRGDKIKLIGVDQDLEALGLAEQKLRSTEIDNLLELSFLHTNFRDLTNSLTSIGITAVDGLLCDLGVSSMQFDNACRGFSFRKSAKLDMRMNQKQQLTAYTIVNEYPEDILGEIFRGYGEIKTWRKLAASVAAYRRTKRIETTDDLVRAMAPALHWRYGKSSSLHPATLPFQAIRIAVNDELKSLRCLIEQSKQLLKPDGIISIISFHSLEDRIVKRAFRDDDNFLTISRKPIIPEEDEILSNPRSRSAKLRIARRRNTRSL